MQISIKAAEDVTIVALEGRLDSETSPVAEGRLAALVADGANKVVVDFDGLSYLSSAGLRVLLAAARALKTRNGEMRICCLRHAVREVFDISGFITVFAVFPSVSDALEGF